MKVNLKDFFTNGKLGPVYLGLSRNDIHHLMGEPQDWTSPEAKVRAAIWKYGGLQIGFEKDMVSFIGIYFHDDFDLSEILDLEGYFPTRQIGWEELKEYLHNEGIKGLSEWVCPKF